MNFTQIEREYLRIRDDLFNLLVSSTKSKDLTEDILQDSIMEILKKHNNGEEIKSKTFKKFLYTIAYTKMIDQLRKPYLKREISTEDLPTGWDRGQNDKNDHSLSILEILNNLLEDESRDKRMREVLKLRLIQKVKIDNICNILSVSRQTVYRDYEYGIKILREAFLEKNLSPEDLEA